MLQIEELKDKYCSIETIQTSDCFSFKLNLFDCPLTKSLFAFVYFLCSSLNVMSYDSGTSRESKIKCPVKL